MTPPEHSSYTTAKPDHPNAFEAEEYDLKITL